MGNLQYDVPKTEVMQTKVVDFTKIIMNHLPNKYRAKYGESAVGKVVESRVVDPAVKCALLFTDMEVSKPTPNTDIKYLLHVGLWLNSKVYELDFDSKGEDVSFDRTSSLDEFFEGRSCWYYMPVFPGDLYDVKERLDIVRYAETDDNLRDTGLVKTYNILENNCEHYASYVVFGEKYSAQIEISEYLMTKTISILSRCDIL